MKILALDDEYLAMEGICSVLKEVNPQAEVKGFRYSDEALSCSADWFPDVAFLDIEMREENGVSVAKKMKEQNPKINIIFVTGFSDYMREAFDLYASGYVLKPATPEQIKRELGNLRFPVSEKKKIYVHTFGPFEIFADGIPLKFSYSKSKELLAILIDEKGLPCPLGKLEEMLWENNLSDKSSYIRNLVADIRKTLRACGSENILIHNYNQLAIDKDAIDCDYFDYLDGKPSASASFNFEYMSQYTWAESTLGFLVRKIQKNL